MDSDSDKSGANQFAAGRTTQPAEGGMNDARMEIVMGRLLQAGVLLAATVILTGGVMYMVAHAGQMANYRMFVAQPVELRHPAAMLKGIARGDARAILQLGILLLVATPICRVIFAVVAFSMERDRLYVAISLTVLAVLLVGMLRSS